MGRERKTSLTSLLSSFPFLPRSASRSEPIAIFGQSAPSLFLSLPLSSYSSISSPCLRPLPSTLHRNRCKHRPQIFLSPLFSFIDPLPSLSYLHPSLSSSVAFSLYNSRRPTISLSTFSRFSQLRASIFPFCSSVSFLMCTFPKKCSFFA